MGKKKKKRADYSWIYALLGLAPRYMSAISQMQRTGSLNDLRKAQAGWYDARAEGMPDEEVVLSRHDVKGMDDLITGDNSFRNMIDNEYLSSDAGKAAVRAKHPQTWWNRNTWATSGQDMIDTGNYGELDQDVLNSPEYYEFMKQRGGSIEDLLPYLQFMGK